MSVKSVTEKTAPPQKRLPIRSCIVCRERSEKRTLIRLVRSNEGVMVDLTGKRNGRGAYLCDNRNCWERALSSDILSKALRTMVTDQDRERLRQAMP